MGKTKNSVFTAVAFIVCVAVFAFSTQFAAAEVKIEPLVSVEYIGVNPAVESIDADAPSISGDIHDSLTSSKLGGDRTSESAFLLRSQKDLILEFFTVGDFTAQGRPTPDELLGKYSLKNGDVYLFRHHVPEGMPNLIVCARAGKTFSCWVPRFSGVDGSVELDPGFAPFTKN